MTAQYDPTEVSRLLEVVKRASREGGEPKSHLGIYVKTMASQLEAASALLERCKPFLYHRNDGEVLCANLKHSDYCCSCGLADLLNQIEGKK